MREDAVGRCAVVPIGILIASVPEISSETVGLSVPTPILPPFSTKSRISPFVIKDISLLPYTLPLPKVIAAGEALDCSSLINF